MSKLREEYRIELADGQVRQVVADQRDWAAMEVQDFPASAMLTKVRHLAYTAAVRQRLVTCSWDTFNTELCVDVESLEDAEDDGEGEQGLDPGQKTASAAGTAKSGTRPASR